ncbi:MAG: hypothetical protein WC413_02950 [Candidatus Nanoarchaeia archaeon]
MKLKKIEIKEILANYNLGEFKSFGKILKNDTVSLSQIIETTKGKFFLKVFRNFGLSDKQGLIVMYRLKKQGFPTFKVYSTKKKKLFISYQNNNIAIFEYVKIKEHTGWVSMNKEMIRDYAKTLAKFHVMTKNIKISQGERDDLSRLNRLANIFYKKRMNYSKKYQIYLNFILKEAKNIKIPKKEYTSGYYSEFNPGHVIFSKNKVKYVIDWTIDKDKSFLDFGGSAAACFSLDGTKFSYENFKEYVKSYDEVRKLSKWEKEHLYEAVKFGCLKYGLWAFADINTKGMTKEKNLDQKDINKIQFIMDTPKEMFLKRLK